MSIKNPLTVDPKKTAYPFNLRLNDTFGSPRAIRQKIHTARKAVFKFLTEEIPDPRAIFHIRGKRYICEKITATFTEKGMTPLLKGEFWSLAE